MQSLPACLSINQAEWPQGCIPNLHCTCIFSGRRKALLREQMEGKSLFRIHSLPGAHPLTTGHYNESVTAIPWHPWLPLPFCHALAAHLFIPHCSSPSFTFKQVMANTVRESYCSCSPSRYKTGWVMCAICSFYLQVCMKNVSGKFWADGSESYGVFLKLWQVLHTFVFWQELCISYTSL